ncbi:AAA domain-containing protein [Streptococcus sp. H49]|uniref:AAA domain-containing protein n=1 Tax=Streptococcus huangxiaojuni TaxID=3237239 RepID=UPI0034A3B0BB
MLKKRDKLIILSGKNQTDDIKQYTYIPIRKKYAVDFHGNSKTYFYSVNNVSILKSPEELNPIDFRITLKRTGKEFYDVTCILKFENSKFIYYVIYCNNYEFIYKKDELIIIESSLSDTGSKKLMYYLKELSHISSLKNPDTGEKLLVKRYSDLDFVDPKTALSNYLNPSKSLHISKKKIKQLIFPFGCNRSQYRATKAAFENQISVIQGPPGTGKTQTILNIIANILLQDKTVLVVSNNNTAIENVYDKLANDKYKLEFLTAFLGNSGNKKEFVKNQSSHYPKFVKADISKDSDYFIDVKKLNNVFKLQEEKAILQQELSELELEYEHFKEYFKNQNGRHLELKMPSHRVLSLWQDCEAIYNHYFKLNLFFKIKSFFKYGIRDWSFYQQDLPDLTIAFQAYFYKKKGEELRQQIKQNELDFKRIKGQYILDNLSEDSLLILKSKLAKRFSDKTGRKQYTVEDLWQDSQQFLKDYPIVLSTTFSSKNSLNKNIIYDYLIIDEASQVDIATGALALSCAKNVVIVGDTKQLSHIVSSKDKKISEEIFKRYKVGEGYRFTNSFLQSILDIFPNIPQTLLREHYRCHPKIINFCNQKFYRGKLIVMTEDKGESDVLRAIRTPTGNHARNHFSQREIDIINRDILKNYPLNFEEAAIITPYRNHADKVRQQVDGVDSATVHKFQGKEKRAVIISTVDNIITRFTDNPNLLNVAVSRAKNNLFLVMSGNKQSPDKNISDLLGYIDYYNFEHRESPIYSIFDYLYKQYEEKRVSFLKKHRRISQYDSENLMYILIRKILNERTYDNLNIVHNYAVRQVIKDKSRLTEEEKIYIERPNTHIDFVIINKITSQIVLAIEVDGYFFHSPFTKQFTRDQMKDKIFEKYQIPLLRFATNGSQEEDKLRNKLTDILGDYQFSDE